MKSQKKLCWDWVLYRYSDNTKIESASAPVYSSCHPSLQFRGPAEYEGFAADQLRTCQSFIPRIVEWEQNSFSRVLNSKLIFETFAARNFWFGIIFKTLMNCYLNNSNISATVTQTAAAHPAQPACCSPEGCIGRKRGLPPALWRCLALCSPSTPYSAWWIRIQS